MEQLTIWSTKVHGGSVMRIAYDALGLIKDLENGSDNKEWRRSGVIC